MRLFATKLEFSAPIELSIWFAVCWMHSKLSNSSAASPE